MARSNTDDQKVWRYSGVVADTGRKMSGRMIAVDPASARDSLRREHDLVGVDIRPANVMHKLQEKMRSALGKPKRNDIIDLLRNLAQFVALDKPLVEAMALAAEQLPDSNPLKPRLESMVARITEGTRTVSEAFSEHIDVFGEEVAAVLGAGIESGSLEQALDALASLAEARAEVRSAVLGGIRKQLSQMVILTLVCVVGTIFMSGQIINLYEAMGADDPLEHLPPLTVALINGRAWLTQNWLLVLFGIAVLVMVGQAIGKHNATRERLSALSLRLPLIGTTLRGQAIMQVCATMGQMLTANITDQEALRVASRASRARVFSVALARAADRMSTAGLRFTEAVIAIAPPLPNTVRLFASQAAEGATDRGKPWTTLAERTRKDTLVAVERMTIKLQPIILVIGAVMVVIMGLAFYLPMLQAPNVLIDINAG